MHVRTAFGWILSAGLVFTGACSNEDGPGQVTSPSVASPDAGEELSEEGEAIGAGGVTLGVPRLDGGATGDADPSTGLDAGISAGADEMDAGPGELSGSSGGDGDASTDALSDGGADAGPPASSPVTGKVIDFFRNPVPNVVVRVGDASVTTGADGSFTFEDVGETYDVSLSLSVPRPGGIEAAGWLYVGLTRRDPTLQVHRGLPRRGVNVSISFENAPSPVPDTQHIQIAHGGQYGTSEVSSSSGFVSWEGPSTAQTTAHVLHWEDDGTSAHLPVGYFAHDVQALALDAANPSSLTFDLSPAKITTGLITVEVVETTAAERHNALFMRFRDGAAIQLVNQYSAPDSFSYLVPVVNDAAFVVAAVALRPGYSVAYRDGVTPGDDISLDPPRPASPLGPGNGSTGIGTDTAFSWSGPEQVYLLHVENEDYLESFYVVTAAQSATIPAAPVTNLALQAGQAYWWNVVTNNRQQSVDEAAGPDGFLGAYRFDELEGPHRGDGTHTESPAFSFTSAN